MDRLKWPSETRQSRVGTQGCVAMRAREHAVIATLYYIISDIFYSLKFYLMKSSRNRNTSLSAHDLFLSLQNSNSHVEEFIPGGY